MVPTFATVSDASKGLAVGTASEELEYPEQRHAGAVENGSEFKKGVGVDEKIAGIKDQLKGKITGNPELVEYGRERRTGELKRRDQEADEMPFERNASNTYPSADVQASQKAYSTDHSIPPPIGSKAKAQNRAEYEAGPHPAQPPDQSQSGTATHQNTNFVRDVAGSNEGAVQQAAFTAPEGSKEFALQSQRASGQGMKYIG